MAKMNAQTSNTVNIAKMHYNLEQNDMAIRIFEQLGDDEIRKHRAEFIAAHCHQLIGDKQSEIKYYKMASGPQTPSESAYDMANRHRARHDMG